MSIDPTNALEQAVSALLVNDSVALKDICEKIDDTQLNMCLVQTALSSSAQCVQIVVSPLKGLYDSSADCLNLLTQKNPDEEIFKVLLPLANPATVHTLSGKSLWSIALLFKMPATFYQNWNPDSKTVAQALPSMSDCTDVQLLEWCVKKACEISDTTWAGLAWKTAQDVKNYQLLHLLASNVAFPNQWAREMENNWPMWESSAPSLTQYPQLAALVVSVAVGKNNWVVVHTLLPHAEKSTILTDACVARQNIFACNWVFSYGCVLSTQTLWNLISQPEEKPLNSQTLKFFKDLLECDQKWNMGVWDELKKECGTNQLFCQLLMHGEEAADIVRGELDPGFANSLPLRLAAILGREQTFTEVLPHSDPQLYNSQALALAALNGHSQLVKQLLPHSNSADDCHRALACALWFDSQHNTDVCSSLLITSETSPEHMIQLWKKQMQQHCGDRYINLFQTSANMSSHEKWDNDDDDIVSTLNHLFSNECYDNYADMRMADRHMRMLDRRFEREDDGDRCVVYGNTLFEPHKTHPMSWSNFDQPIENWWSSLENSHLRKIGMYLSKVFPNALKKHLCDANEKDQEAKKRKI